MNPFFSIKSFIKKRSPKIFGFIKKILNSKPITPFYKKIYSSIFPPNERYDPDTLDAEIKYFNEYAGAIIDKIHGKVLDLGCGFGYLTKKIADKRDVKDAYAVDKISPDEFRFLNHPKIKYFQRNITALKQEPQFSDFDVVVSTEFVEHIKEKDFINLLEWIKNCLRKGGVFVGSTPNNKTSFPKFSNVVYHIREYQPEYFDKLLESGGFKNIKIEIYGDFFIWQCEK